MASQNRQLFFVLFPFMAQGRMFPMINIARILAQRGVMITIVTTPHNAARFQTVVACAIESGLQIRLVQQKFPCEEAGLPDGCEDLDMLPSQDLTLNFFTGIAVLQQPVEKLFEELNPKPNCKIFDICLPWTINISRMFHIPRILNISVRVGGDDTVTSSEEKNGVFVKKENVKDVIEKLMDGEDSKGRKERARELREMAKRAVEEGGSSHLDIALLLIQDILQQESCRDRS